MYLKINYIIKYIYSIVQNANTGCFITGQTHAKPSNGAVDSTKSHFQPSVGITIKAKRTSKHAPSAQKH